MQEAPSKQAADHSGRIRQQRSKHVGSTWVTSKFLPGPTSCIDVQCRARCSTSLNLHVLTGTGDCDEDRGQCTQGSSKVLLLAPSLSQECGHEMWGRPQVTVTRDPMPYAHHSQGSHRHRGTPQIVIETISPYLPVPLPVAGPWCTHLICLCDDCGITLEHWFAVTGGAVEFRGHLVMGMATRASQR